MYNLKVKNRIIDRVKVIFLAEILCEEIDFSIGKNIDYFALYIYGKNKEIFAIYSRGTDMFKIKIFNNLYTNGYFICEEEMNEQDLYIEVKKVREAMLKF